MERQDDAPPGSSLLSDLWTPSASGCTRCLTDKRPHPSDWPSAITYSRRPMIHRSPALAAVGLLTLFLSACNCGGVTPSVCRFDNDCTMGKVCVTSATGTKSCAAPTSCADPATP